MHRGSSNMKKKPKVVGPVYAEEKLNGDSLLLVYLTGLSAKFKFCYLQCV